MQNSTINIVTCTTSTYLKIPDSQMNVLPPIATQNCQQRWWNVTQQTTYYT